MPNIDKNVFVSHIHEDDEKVAKLKENLKAKGYEIRDYSVTKDNPNNAHNDDYIKNEILKPRLDASSVLAVIVTPETKDSKWVDWEIEYASKHDKRIVCIWAHGHSKCEAPEALETHTDSFVSWKTDNIIGALDGKNYSEDCLGKPRSKSQIPPPPDDKGC